MTGWLRGSCSPDVVESFPQSAGFGGWDCSSQRKDAIMAQSTLPIIETNVVRLSGSALVRNQTVKRLREYGYSDIYISMQMEVFDALGLDAAIFMNSSVPGRQVVEVFRP